MSKVFVDTNVLLYGLDPADHAKRVTSENLLRRLDTDRNGVISTQVMQEFYAGATKKMRVAPLTAKAVLASFGYLEVVTVTPAIIHQAIDVSANDKVSFWDALIIAAAASAGCTELWTEDLNHGQVIRGVRVHNPYRAS